MVRVMDVKEMEFSRETIHPTFLGLHLTFCDVCDVFFCRFFVQFFVSNLFQFLFHHFPGFFLKEKGELNGSRNCTRS